MARLGKRDWQQRTALLRREALAGKVGAMADLGLLLQEGIQDERGRAIVRRNPRAGFRLLLRAAVNGDTSAAFSLGYAYDVGLGTRRDKRQALRWYHRAYRAGSSTAASNVATVHRDDRNLRLAFQWWRRAVELGDGDAAVDAGYCYQYGVGTGPSVRVACRMYKGAIASKFITASGREEAMYHLAVVYIDEGKARLALPLLVQAAADGDFPEADSLLHQIRSKTTIVPCRCRRDLLKTLPGHAACLRHPYSSVQRHRRHDRRKAGPRSGHRQIREACAS